MSHRDRLLLELSQIYQNEHNYTISDQNIIHLVTEMQSDDKFVSYTAAKALHSVLIKSKELSLHSVMLTRLFGGIQTGALQSALFIGFSLELISKLLKSFHDNDQFIRTSGFGQLYFGSLQKVWPSLLQLHLTSQSTCGIISFVSFTSDILKYRFDGCSPCRTGEEISSLLSTLSHDERAILSCQVSIIEIFTHEIVSGLLNLCISLFEVKKCLGLFTRISKFTCTPHELCGTVLNVLTTSTLVQRVLLDWLSCQSSTTDVCYIRDIFEVTTVRTEIDNSGKSLLATVVRKLLVLSIKCLSVVVTNGKDGGWLGQLEMLCNIPGSSSESFSENSLRNLILEVLLDQDTAIVDALTYCLTITQTMAASRVDSGAVLHKVLDVNLLFIKFLFSISHDHLVLVDYVISNETCFVDFLTQYMMYIHDNWSTFTASLSKLQDITRTVHEPDDNKPMTLVLSSRKRKHDHLTQPIAIVLPDSQLQCNLNAQPTPQSLVSYDLTDSSDSEAEYLPTNKPILHDTMSCMIRLRLALERMLDKQIILNPQAPTELVNVMEKVEVLYESID
ncbi:uncharacterized protein [Dysidea avara]|uniref:uncharacterized protein isoform X2 n=1 Tax=Dysidea avara TaxID=196820 RepID=UPI00331BB640